MGQNRPVCDPVKIFQGVVAQQFSLVSIQHEDTTSLLHYPALL